MSRLKRLEEKLNETFSPVFLSVEDETEQHHGHASWSGEPYTHLKITVVCEKFRGLSRIEAQRLVYAVLAEEIAQGLHAMRLDLKAPE